MADFIPGPIILPSAPNTAQNFTINLPDSVLRRKGNIVGYLIENYSAFGAWFHGEKISFHLFPYTGVFVPAFSAVLQSITTDASQVRPLSPFDSQATFFHVFYDLDDGDNVPEPYRVYSIANPISRWSSRANIAFIAATLANSSSAHTTTLGPFAVSTLPGGGLYLTHLSFMFGNPAGAAAGDCTLTDIANSIWNTYHLNLTVAGPQVHAEVNFTEALVGAINAGNGQWNFNNPAITNGPGYSINMIGYLI